MKKNSYCSFCGYAFDKEVKTSMQCKHCHNVTYINPIPATATMVEISSPEKTGVLLIRRAIEPKLGELALPGGFLEAYETWQEGAARELQEETGLVINPKDIFLSSLKHSASGTLIIVTHTSIDASELTSLMQFQANDEVSELVIWWPGDQLELGFPTHEEAIREAFGV